MAVIIGKSTSVRVTFQTGEINQGIESVDWSYGSNVNRLYALGTTQEECGIATYAQIQSCEVSVSLSVYGGASPEVSLCPPQGCTNGPNTAVITIIPGSCTPLQTINVTAFVNSYGYNKAKNEFGKESWSFTGYDNSIIQQQPGVFIQQPPSVVLLGVSEGTIECETETNIEAIVGARLRTNGVSARSSKGNVAAGNPGIGEYMNTIHGTFRSVGNSIGYAPYESIVARANVTVSLQPIYL